MSTLCHLSPPEDHDMFCTKHSFTLGFQGCLFSPLGNKGMLYSELYITAPDEAIGILLITSLIL